MKKTVALFAFVFRSVSAQEMCFSCSGTYWLRGQGQQKDRMEDNHAFGLSLDRSTMNIT